MTNFQDTVTGECPTCHGPAHDGGISCPQAQPSAQVARSVRQRDREKVENWRQKLLVALRAPNASHDLLQALLEHGPDWEE